MILSVALLLNHKRYINTDCTKNPIAYLVDKINMVGPNMDLSQQEPIKTYSSFKLIGVGIKLNF